MKNERQKGMPHHCVENEMLGMAEYQLWMVPKHSCGANNVKTAKKLSENRNLIEMTHLLMVLGMPDHHIALHVRFGCPQTVAKGSHAAEKLKIYEKWSKNRNIIGETYIVKVLCLPAHHPALPGSHKWVHNAPKGSRAAENSKIYEKWSKSRNIIGKTYIWRVLCRPAHHPTIPGSYNWTHNMPKSSCA